MKVIFLEGADVNTEDENGCTALMKASECGHNKCVKLLIKTGADVDKRNTKGFTALMFASENGHSKCLKLLIEAGANVNKLYQDFTGLTLTSLKLASSEGHKTCVELMLKAGANVWSPCNRDVLVHAAVGGSPSCLDTLIKAGADLSAEADGFESFEICALMGAAIEGHHECVDLLIRAGADVNQCNLEETTPLIMVATAECADLLIRAGADLNVRDELGITPLSAAVQCGDDKAAEYGQRDCVDLLIKRGAGINDVTNDGNTAPKLVVKTPVRSVEDGRDVYPKPNPGRNGDFGRFVPSANLLIKAGADVDIVDYDGNTALNGAMRLGWAEFVNILIEEGADVNTSNFIENTVLHTAVSETDPDVDCAGFVESVRSVLRAGIYINMLNEDGLNALSYYAEKSQDLLGCPCGGQCRKEVAHLMFVAGETVDEDAEEIPDHLNAEQRLRLKHTCRETIRKHLISLDPHTHLFKRVPSLKLPSSLTRYLLYDVSLDD